LRVLLGAVLSALLTPAPSLAAAVFRTNDITEAGFAAPSFKLMDHSGRIRTLADFKGKVVVIAFGFTSCPDVCPTTLAAFASVVQALGKDAQRVQVLFMTLDPERDTAPLLSAYVPAFHPSFIGLRGSADQTRKTARDFRVFYRKVETGAGGNYTIDHSTHSYVFGPDGRLRLFLRMGVPTADIEHDLKLLLANQ
jgi:protein SCO1/2